IVLIQGETGTGKGMLARWIHGNGARSAETFVEVNCAGLRGEMLESELFGHVKGAFTSAVQDREGLIEVADGGTLFLDEIGDMDLGVQAQFLKAIEERTYRRMGETRERKSNFRLMCATNRDLFTEVENGKFRRDLYYRICVFPLNLPALKERTEDFRELSEHLLNAMDKKNTGISDEALDQLKKYCWPGNIRELRNMLERAVLLSRGEMLFPEHFPGLTEHSRPDEFPSSDRSFPDDGNSTPSNTLESVEQEHVRKIVEKYRGDTKKACVELGISRASLYRKLNKIKES
ncbi:MAG: sigma 54-interacting transcriptional regulator, partial [Fibrobacterota bacterium]